MHWAFLSQSWRPDSQSWFTGKKRIWELLQQSNHIQHRSCSNQWRLHFEGRREFTSFVYEYWRQYWWTQHEEQWRHWLIWGFSQLVATTEASVRMVCPFVACFDGFSHTVTDLCWCGVQWSVGHVGASLKRFASRYKKPISLPKDTSLLHVVYPGSLHSLTVKICNYTILFGKKNLLFLQSLPGFLNSSWST